MSVTIPSTPEILSYQCLSSSTGHLSDGLKAYWRFDESSGTAMDVFNNVNLAPHNTIAYSQTSKTGFNTCLGFADGTGCYMNSSNVSYINPSHDKFSISFWVYFDKFYSTSGQTQYVINISRTTAPWYWVTFYVDADDHLVFYFKTADLASCECHSQFFGTLQINTWYHIVGVAHGIGNYAKFYINNSSANSFTIQSDIIAHADSGIAVGGVSGGTETCGRIDEIGIWDRALSATEVSELYNDGNGLSYNHFAT